MRVPLPGGAIVNVAHISLLSGVQKVDRQPQLRTLRIVLMGSHVHEVGGTEDEIKQLHTRLSKAIDELDAGSPHE